MKKSILALLAAVLLLPACSKDLNTTEKSFSATAELVAGQTGTLSIDPESIRSFLNGQQDSRISMGVTRGGDFEWDNSGSWWFNSRGIAVDADAEDAVFCLTRTSDMWNFNVTGDDELIYQSVGSSVTALLAYRVVQGANEYVARVYAVISVLKGEDSFSATATVKVGGAEVMATVDLAALAKALKLSTADDMLGGIASGTVKVYPVDSAGNAGKNNASDESGTNFNYGAWFDLDGNVVEKADAAYRCNITLSGMSVAPGPALEKEGECSFRYCFARDANKEYVDVKATAKGVWASYKGSLTSGGISYDIKMTPSSNLPLKMSVPDEVYSLLALTNYKGLLGSLLETGLIHVYAFNGAVDLKNIYTGRHTAGSKLDPTKEYGGTYFGQTHGYWFNGKSEVCQDTDSDRMMSFVITNEGSDKAFIEVQQAPGACKAGQSTVFGLVLYNEDFVEMLGSKYVPLIFNVSIVSDL